METPNQSLISSGELNTAENNNNETPMEIDQANNCKTSAEVPPTPEQSLSEELQKMNTSTEENITKKKTTVTEVRRTNQQSETLINDSNVSLSDTLLSSAYRRRCLIEGHAQNEMAAIKQFKTNYNLKFGQPYPNFYMGKLKNALNEIKMQPFLQRKVLALFLYNGKSIRSNIFCSQVMRDDCILKIFSKYFLLYGWDVTQRGHAKEMYDRLFKVQRRAAKMLRKIKLDDFPAFMLICVERSAGFRHRPKVINGTNESIAFEIELMKCVQAFRKVTE
ncbi:FAS-associated factor 1-like isoform X2 [Drosophila subobscura]|uniref:FAS-associated factor 1-like isoform X2 n=1 Tax=Drosophila subobscura TaxID=7241 RepID=UPI00155AEABD|nr:FAS-associated factor 1-like isoform X2 [Drosophila subobscura]